MFTLYLTVHIIAGFVCLISGLVAMLSKKRKGSHSKAGGVYHWSYTVIFVTSVIMAVLHWETSQYLFYIALFSYALALQGYLAAKKKRKGWVQVHIGGMLGSYIGIVTATIVVNIAKVPFLNELPVLLFWFLPTIIGTPLIVKAGQKYNPRKPKKGTVPKAL